MSDRSTEKPLPLRQTCNRCRELKVRCQRTLKVGYGNDVLACCVRCNRAGVICTYSPQQRSGRPRFASKNSMSTRHSTPERKQSSGSFPNMLTPPSDTSLDTYETLPSAISPDLALPDIQWMGFERSEDDVNAGCLLQPSEEPTSSSTFVFGGDNMSNEMVAAVNSIPSSGSPCVNDGLAEGIIFRVPEYHEQPQQVHLGSTLRLIEDLSSLNACIYKAISTFPMQKLRDEMIEMVSTFLRIVATLVNHPRKPRPINHQSVSTVASPSSCRRDSIESSICSSDSHILGARFPDTATAMMAYSCYQRFLDLFRQVCLNLHQTLRGSCRKERISPSSVANGTSDDIGSSTAQVVMTLELVNHLLGRLHRGLHQLTGALNVGMHPPYSPKTMPSPRFSSNSMSSPGISSRPSSLPTQVAACDYLSGSRGEPRATSCFHDARYLIDTMEQSQSSLYAHIKLIRALIEESLEI